MFILLVVADKARHDMKAQAVLRNKAIKALVPKDEKKSNRFDNSYDDAPDYRDEFDQGM